MSSPPSGPSDATVDRYQAQIPVEPGRRGASAFERLRERPFIYDIFPGWFVR